MKNGDDDEISLNKSFSVFLTIHMYKYAKLYDDRLSNQGV